MNNRHACSFAYFLEYILLLLDNVDEECQSFSGVKSSVSGCCLAFAWFFANYAWRSLLKTCFSLKKKKACSEAYCRKASLMLRFSQNTSIKKNFLFFLWRKLSRNLQNLKSHSGNLTNIKKYCPWLKPILKKLLRREEFPWNFR